MTSHPGAGIGFPFFCIHVWLSDENILQLICPARMMASIVSRFFAEIGVYLHQVFHSAPFELPSFENCLLLSLVLFVAPYFFIIDL
jgi:hypothetical protein